MLLALPDPASPPMMRSFISDLAGFAYRHAAGQASHTAQPRMKGASYMSATQRMSRWACTAIIAIGLASGYVALSQNSAVRAADEKPARAGTFEVYKDKGGEFRWRLRAVNKQVIATSGQGYKEKRDCLNGIESVKKNAADAKVEEVAAE
jgi:uncharacterized protein YegP (UPF0339 family)